jgi:hypothetical protein
MATAAIGFPAPVGDTMRLEPGVASVISPPSAGPAGVDQVALHVPAAGNVRQSEPAQRPEATADGVALDFSTETAVAAAAGQGPGTARQNGASEANSETQKEIPAEIKRQNIRHIAEAAHQINRGTVEVTLTPEDLGQVRLTIKSHDANGATVILQADRPETLDLMRRHVELLAQDMRDLGYEELSFTFQDRQQGNGQASVFHRASAHNPLGALAPVNTSAGTDATGQRPSLQDGRLDIRI